MAEQPEHDEAFPRLPRELFALVQATGERRSVAAGDVLTRSGEVVPIFEKWFGSMTTAGPLIAAMYLLNGLPE